MEIAAPGSRAGLAAVGRVLAAAFLDDPVWRSVGPRARRHRALTNRLSFWGSLRASSRLGARIRLAQTEPGAPVAGATVAFEPGHWPPPDSAFAWELPWGLAAGPLPIARGLRIDRAMRESHVEHDHVYLWFIGVAPELQGRGVGRELMAELHADSDRLGLPTYLETGTERNVAFYESLGYEVLGRIAVRGVSPMWRMERPASEAS